MPVKAFAQNEKQVPPRALCGREGGLGPGPRPGARALLRPRGEIYSPSQEQAAQGGGASGAVSPQSAPERQTWVPDLTSALWKDQHDPPGLFLKHEAELPHCNNWTTGGSWLRTRRPLSSLSENVMRGRVQGLDKPSALVCLPRGPPGASQCPERGSSEAQWVASFTSPGCVL